MKLNIVMSLFCLLYGCTQPKNSKTKYYFDKKHLVKEEYDEHGRLRLKASFNKDTIPLGYHIEYYTNGKIHKWLWYDKLNEHPLFGIYFDSLGNFKEYGGTPFIRNPRTPNGSIAIEMVNPPLIYYVMVYEDYNVGKLSERIIYEPAKSDTTSWVDIQPLQEYKKGHQYFIKYILFNYDNIPIDSIRVELEP